ncbi:12583_t:CDS:2 [Entrophospora sp. SA101]|nr:12583_t:CDS:2 [Entrophospora sp. SA101]
MFIYVRCEEKNVKTECKPTDDIKELRNKIAERLGIKYSPEKQRLFFGGKQLENGHTLFHYGIKNTNTVLLFQQDPIKQKVTKLDNNISVKIPIVAIVEETIPPDCGCNVCGGKGEEESTVVCDECQYYFHFRCLKPRMTSLPKDDWFCDVCKNDNSKVILAGQKLDLTNSKKSKMHSATQTKKWGGGMACVGLTKKCEIVGPDHFGPIPGIPVGSSWKYRINCSESGVHRPPVSGIAGKARVGAVSIVLGGGYPEDKDNGEEFTYTGSGGRDLKTGNKRTAEQSSDQELTKQNEALALTCDAPINKNEGAEAKDWTKSKPIRVCRTDKLKKHNPQYAPDEGVRYDGIYKVVKYWPEKGTSGFIVWRFFMRRDDTEPAPWTPEGMKRIIDLGLKMYMPEECKDNRKHSLTTEEISGKSSLSTSKNKKARKASNYKLPSDTLKLIKKDILNKRVWNTVLRSEYETLADLISSLVEKHFKCPVCHELLEDPVTTPCTHSICNECIKQSVKYYGKKCPECRTKFKEDLECSKNQNLVDALKSIIPTYGL